MIQTAMRLPILCALLLAACGGAFAQKYSGRRPPQKDLPYLKHAETLVATEAGEAKEEKGKKDEITYVIAGATSTAKTPLASPIFLLLSDKIAADRLQLYRLETRNGRRELTVSPKKPGKAILMTVSRLGPDGLYKLEVNDSLEAGEYSLSPQDSNAVFCFTVY
jgi:hypothetical protein